MKKAIQQKLLYLSVLLLSSCALIVDPLDNGIPPIRHIESAEVSSLLTDLAEVPLPIRKPVVAVYPSSFKDDTGQRRSNSQYASFSTAITQAPDAYLIRALQHSGVFDVVERTGLDNLTKERQIIRTTRENFEEKQKVKPLMFAGLLMEGGVVGYETNIKSGGAGVLKANLTGSDGFPTYVTEIGLYDGAEDLIGIAKLSKPIPKSRKIPMRFFVRMDY